MKLGQSIKIGAWLLIILNLLMAFGSIWIFMRMAPAIKVIIAQNAVSLDSCADMLASLAASHASPQDVAGTETFLVALDNAKNNVTETHEHAPIAMITKYYPAAFKGDDVARGRTINAIIELGEINRDAMRRADARAQQLGYAGAWGVVFMATFSFTVGLIYLRSLRKKLIEPLDEIDAVASAVLAGERMRRCTMKNPSQSQETNRILSKVNALLDANCSYREIDK